MLMRHFYVGVLLPPPVTLVSTTAVPDQPEQLCTLEYGMVAYFYIPNMRQLYQRLSYVHVPSFWQAYSCPPHVQAF